MHPDKVILLAGGRSVSEYDLTELDKKGYVIGVNDAFLKYEGCSAGLTMDRAWMEARADQVIATGKPFFVRHAAVKYIVDKISDIDSIRLYDCLETHEMSQDPHFLNGTSSGMCALNLALQLNPEVIYLLGYDMQGGRWYEYDFKNWEPLGNKFNKWVRQFHAISKTLKKSPKIINVNHMSALECFPKITYREFMNDA